MDADDLLEFESPSSILAEVSSGDLDVLSDSEGDKDSALDTVHNTLTYQYC